MNRSNYKKPIIQIIDLDKNCDIISESCYTDCPSNCLVHCQDDERCQEYGNMIF